MYPESNKVLHKGFGTVSRRHRKLCTQEVFGIDKGSQDDANFSFPLWLPCDDAEYQHELGRLKTCTVDIHTLFTEKWQSISRDGFTTHPAHKMLREAQSLLSADLSPLSLQEKLPYFNKLQLAYHGPTGLATSNATEPPQNPSCELGLQAVAIDARYCLPCEIRVEIEWPHASHARTQVLPSPIPTPPHFALQPFPATQARLATQVMLPLSVTVQCASSGTISPSKGKSHAPNVQLICI